MLEHGTNTWENGVSWLGTYPNSEYSVERAQRHFGMSSVEKRDSLLLFPDNPSYL